MEVSDQFHAPAALPPVPLGKVAGWADDVENGKFLTLLEFEL
jgi:hypothetical protein